MADCQNVSFLFRSRARKNSFRHWRSLFTKINFFVHFCFQKISKNIEKRFFFRLLLFIFGWKSSFLFSQQTNKSDRKRLITCFGWQLNWEQMISALCIFTTWHNGQMCSFKTYVHLQWQNPKDKILKFWGFIQNFV